jgi:hypothetical protein
MHPVKQVYSLHKGIHISRLDVHNVSAPIPQEAILIAHQLHDRCSVMFHALSPDKRTGSIKGGVVTPHVGNQPPIDESHYGLRFLRLQVWIDCDLIWRRSSPNVYAKETCVNRSTEPSPRVDASDRGVGKRDAGINQERRNTAGYGQLAQQGNRWAGSQ